MSPAREQPASATRVLLADDHTLVRAGIRALLVAMPEIDVVGEAADGEAAVQMALRLQPDVILMDIAMKGMNGLRAAAHLHAALPAARVIILSMHATNDYLQQALRAGAAGYLLKDAATLELQLAIAAVMRGDIYLSPTVSAQIVEGYLQNELLHASPHQSPHKSPHSSPLDKAGSAEMLTPRQREILQLIATGKSTKEIAFQLQLSGKTVDTHRAQLMERLGIRDIAGLVRYAMRTGMIAHES